MVIRIEADYGGSVPRVLNRTGKVPPSFKDVARFNRLLQTTFEQTQRAVHVDTGSLKNSGDRDFEWGPSSWEGTISYGGDSPGAVNNPVHYAAAERSRGGTHDFMRPTYDRDQAFLKAVLQSLKDWSK